MSSATRVAIDKAGRIVIPKDLREAAGFRPGVPLEVACVEGTIQIRPAPGRIRLERRGHVTILVPEEAVEPMTAEDVNHLIQDLRDERSERLLRPDKHDGGS